MFEECVLAFMSMSACMCMCVCPHETTRFEWFGVGLGSRLLSSFVHKVWYITKKRRRRRWRRRRTCHEWSMLMNGEFASCLPCFIISLYLYLPFASLTLLYTCGGVCASNTPAHREPDVCMGVYEGEKERERERERILTKDG